MKLWGPVGPAGGEGVPVSARSAGSEKGALTGAVAAGAKKKGGGKEGAAKKPASNEAAKYRSGIGGFDNPGDDDTVVPDADGGAPPVFERILIFGGIVDEATVSGVRLREDTRLHLQRINSSFRDGASATPSARMIKICRLSRPLAAS